MTKWMRAALLLTLAGCLSAALPTAASGLEAGAVRAKSYWTSDRITSAVPRDFAFDLGTRVGRLIAPAVKPTRVNPSASSWTGGGLPLTATGRVFFTMGSFNYSCSGSVVRDETAGRSVVLTAGHCVWDPDSGWATNFTFIPAFDLAPRASCSVTSGPGSFPYGCWTANTLVASDGFTDELDFTTAATAHDWGFAVTKLGGNANSLLDAAVGDFALRAPGLVEGNDAYAFGYPAAGKFKGNDLVYAYGPVFSDIYNGGLTWGMRNVMTGGASGGPWLAQFSTTDKDGVAASVNSYKYTKDSSRMYGPKFNGETVAALAAAKTAEVSVSVP